MTPREFKAWIARVPPVVGSEVIETSDPRHTGTVTAIYGWKARVTWENGWESTIALAKLRRADEEDYR